MLQEPAGLEQFVTHRCITVSSAAIEYEFQSFAEYHAWYPVGAAGRRVLSGKYSRANPAPAGTRFAEPERLPSKETGYRVLKR